LPVRHQQHNSLKCPQCSAEMEFKPGSDNLICNYCGNEKQLEIYKKEIKELDYLRKLQETELKNDQMQALKIECKSCSAKTLLPRGQTAGSCAFCGNDLIISGASTRVIQPQAILPFGLSKEKAKEQYNKWVKSRWFLPSSFKTLAKHEDKLQGIYIPCWTYDSQTFSSYSGFRGEDYWQTEQYIANINGRRQRRTRRVRKTRWYPTSGRVYNAFDDIVVAASGSLPEKQVHNLTPWDLNNLEVFQEDYLSGFLAEQYNFNFKNGFERAKHLMRPSIRNSAARDIGGDRQRVNNIDTNYKDVTFKHILLPVWLAAYSYKNKNYQVLINARTGEVQGIRPWSWFKIALCVILALACITALAFFFNEGSFEQFTNTHWDLHSF